MTQTLAAPFPSIAASAARRASTSTTSSEIGLPMRFSVFLPPQAAERRRCPALLYLAGLTCTEETFMIKAGAQRLAAELGLALIAPDTSPRGPAAESLPGATASWDFGIGAGFYLDATQAPWATHWRMESWIAERAAARWPRGTFRIDTRTHRHLRPLDGRARRADAGAAASGALQVALGLRADLRARPSAPGAKRLSPATWAPTAAAWLRARRQRADAVRRRRRPTPAGILVDQGLADKFLADAAASAAAGGRLRRRRPAAATAAPCRAMTTATTSSRASWRTIWRITREPCLKKGKAVPGHANCHSICSYDGALRT